MRCPTLAELPLPLSVKARTEAGRSTGWPWTEECPQLPAVMPDGSPWPRISIVTPSYNQGAYLEETIRSVLLQGYPDLEYIVIDGGSTDGSVEIIEKYRPWLTYWISEPDRGQSHAINKGFERCTGDLITFQNSDDMYLPHVFGDVGARYARNPEVGAIIGGFHYIDGFRMRSEFVPPRLSHRGPIDLVVTPPNRWRLHQVATFYTRHALDAVGRFVREDLQYTMDRELLYRVCRQYPVAMVNKPYGAFRWHQEGKSKSNYFAADMEYADLHMSYKYANKVDDRKKKRVANYRRAKGYVRYAKDNADRLRAMLALVSALRYRPALLINLGYYRTWLGTMGVLSFLQSK